MLNNLTFCEFAFLERIEMLLRQAHEDNLSVEEQQVLSNIRAFLKRTNLVMSESLESYASGASNDWLRKEFRSAVLRGFTNEDRKKKYSTYSKSYSGCYKNNDPNCEGAIVLSQNKEPSLTNSGVLIFPVDNALSLGTFFKPNIATVDEGDEVLWKSWMDRCLPDKSYNSILIIDNYSAKYTRQNIFPIIRALLPRRFSGVFYLSIVCYAKNNDYEQGFSFNENDLERDVLSRYDYEITPVIIRLNGALAQPEHGIFHDRIIITNYSRVSAGAGLDQIKSRNSTEAGNLTEYIGTYPDFIDSGEDFIRKNLAKFFNNQALIDNIKRNHKEKIYCNPIIRQYMLTEEYLTDKVTDIIRLLKQAGHISEIWYEHLCKPVYNEVQHNLTIFNTYKNERTNSDFTCSKITISRETIIAESGTEGRHNEFINGIKLLPDYEYVVDKGFRYYTDGEGRVAQVKCTLERASIFINKQTLGRNQADRIVKDKNNGVSRLNDDCGHLIAASFGGSNEAINLIPLDEAINKGIQSAAEYEIRHWLKECEYVKISVDLKYSDCSLRPSRILYAANDNLGHSLDISYANDSLSGKKIEL